MLLSVQGLIVYFEYGTTTTDVYMMHQMYDVHVYNVAMVNLASCISLVYCGKVSTNYTQIMTHSRRRRRRTRQNNERMGGN